MMFFILYDYRGLSYMETESVSFATQLSKPLLPDLVALGGNYTNWYKAWQAKWMGR